MDSTICVVGEYLTGAIKVLKADIELQSVDLQLQRNEKLSHSDKEFNEVTEILNL